MADPIRLIHFADVHVGMENYGRLDPSTGTSSRVRDFLDRLDEVIDYGIEHQADLAIFAGDAFKNRDPEPTQQREFAARIKRLSDAVPTLLLVGNHDMAGMASKASSMDIFQALDVPGVILGDKPGGQVVETRRGPVFLAWMPYPSRNRLLAREEYQGKSIEELELALRQVVTDILTDLAVQASAHDMPRVLAGHLAAAEAKLGSERTVMLGRDVSVFTSTLADPSWDYVSLGHIHKHQDLNPGRQPSVVYSGSLERIDFGEEGEPKGFCWVELVREETRWSFIPVHSRPFKTIRVDLREEEATTQAALDAVAGADLAGAIVRVIVRMRADQQAGFHERELETALVEASSVVIVREVEAETRARLGDLSAESLSPIQLVGHFFELRGESQERQRDLLARAEELMRDTD
jgi:DNA repair protein SbcD/Mre11